MKNHVIGYFVLLVFLLCGCEGEDELDQIDILEREAVEIRDFLDKQVVDGNLWSIPYYSKYGLFVDSLYIFNHDTSGVRAGELEYVMFDYVLQKLDGTCLDATDMDHVIDSSAQRTYLLGGPICHALDTGRHYDYVGEALKHIGEGKEGEIVVSSKLGAQNGVSNHYKLQVRRVIPDIFVYENKLIAKYLEVIPRVSEPMLDRQGDTVVYTVLTKRGDGDRLIQVGDKICISHTAAILDEIHLEKGDLRAFQAWDSVVMNHAVANPQVLDAYMQALTHLRAGDEADIIIPFAMGYDRSDVVLKTGQIMIPAYSTLVYRVVIHAVEAPEKPEEEESTVSGDQ